VAGGLEMMLACDLCIADESARFSDGHLNFGQIPGGGSSQRLPRMIGVRRAKDMILSGRFVSTQEALDFGLINRCVPAGELDKAVQETVQSLSRLSFAGRKGAKYLVNEGLKGSISDGLKLEIDYCGTYETTHPDAKEGMLAFRDKRSPQFLPRS
ncbi:MAG: enoyl-CoA hydratase, partial [Rhizobiaceae bacterium]|nr:enoyl-CoA hydratase [Rhizobiaceae bacterium]